jgi:hypothetical protein
LCPEITEPWIDFSLAKIIADICEIIFEKVGKDLEKLLKPEYQDRIFLVYEIFYSKLKTKMEEPTAKKLFFIEEIVIILLNCILYLDRPNAGEVKET